MDSIVSSNNSSIANKDLEVVDVDRHSVDYQPSVWAEYFLKHPFLTQTHKACMTKTYISFHVFFFLFCDDVVPFPHNSF